MFFDEDNHKQYGEDYFKDTRMTFGEHIEALRWHLWRAIIGFAVCLVGSFFIGEPALEFIARPVKQQLLEFELRRINAKIKEHNQELSAAEARGEDLRTEVTRQIDAWALADQLGLKRPEERWITITLREDTKGVALELSKIQQLDINQPTLKVFTILEAMMIYFKVCIYLGIVIGSPWIFWQLWSFIAAGLYPHEKKMVRVYLPFSIVLFLAGVVMCQFFVLPNSVRVLLEFAGWVGVEPELRLSDWLSFAIMLPLVFGIAFQTPLVMFALERVGIFTIDTYRSKRRIAWFALAVIAIIILPTPDGLTMLLMWVPMVLLYELGILMCKLSPHKPLLDLGETDESENLIEV
jgi:sec-independent protein translocase protein TatC